MNTLIIRERLQSQIGLCLLLVSLFGFGLGMIFTAYIIENFLSKSQNVIGYERSSGYTVSGAENNEQRRIIGVGPDIIAVIILDKKTGELTGTAWSKTNRYQLTKFEGNSSHKKFSFSTIPDRRDELENMISDQALVLCDTVYHKPDIILDGYGELISPRAHP